MTFEEFLAAELPGLTRFAGALTGDRDLAEDVLADALLIVSGRWTRISGMEQPLAYVRRVVVTAFLSDRRRAARRRTEPVGDQSLLDRAEPDASEVVARRDFVAQLLTALPPRQRAAVVLRYLLDQTEDEIAKTLGCSAGTVRSHLSRARAALRLTVTAERS